MREDSELPSLPRVMTVKDVADALDISERMVHTYVQDGRLPGHKLGKVTAIRKEDFLAFQRAKQGRPRTKLPIWRKSVGDNLQYTTILTARIRPGQNGNLITKLAEFRAEEAFMLPGTVGRYISHSVDNPDEIQVVLIWRSTVMPKDAERIAAIQALKDELANILDWKTSLNIYGKVLLHT